MSRAPWFSGLRGIRAKLADRRFQRFLRRAFREGEVPTEPGYAGDDAEPIEVPDHLREQVLSRAREMAELAENQQRLAAIRRAANSQPEDTR